MTIEDRYDRFKLIPWWDQATLQQATVFLAGVGAVGNEVLKNLALMGVGRVIVLDKDTIEVTNLTRSVLFRAEDIGRPKAVVAAERAMALDPSCEVVPIVGDLAEVGLGAIAEADVAIGCVDSFYGRLLLNRYCARLGVPWVNGGLGDAMDVFKGVLAVFHAPEGPCFECALPAGKAEAELTQRLSRGGCGATERLAEAVGAVPSTPTMASVIGALQVQEACKILHARTRPEDPVGPWPEPAWGRFITYATGVHEAHGFTRSIRPDCPNHTATPRRHLTDFDEHRPLIELWQSGHLAEDAVVAMPQRVVRHVDCFACGPSAPVWRVDDAETLACPTCGAAARPDTFWYAGADDPAVQRSLSTLGLAAGAYLRVLGETETLLTWPLRGRGAAHV